MADSSGVPDDPVAYSRGQDPYQGLQIEKIDRVNFLNGNVSIALPLGMTYRVGGELSYGLTLAYNSKSFDHVRVTLGPAPYNSDVTGPIPNRHSNAGLGWFLSLAGELDIFCYDQTIAPSPQFCARYISPDGAQHTLYPVLNAFDGGARSVHRTGYYYTRDGSYIRVHSTDDAGHDSETNATTAEIALPDGTVYVYRLVTWGVGPKTSTAFRLTQIHDRYKDAAGRFVNHVDVAYDLAAHTWTITDSAGRRHVVTFAADPTGRFSDGFVSTVDLQGFSGQRPKYQFAYDPPATIHVDPDLPPGNPNQTLLDTVKVVTLNSVTLPDLTTLRTDHYQTTQTGSGESGGLLHQLTLPTGGSISYTYQDYSIPATACTVGASARVTPGVAVRQINDGAGNVGTWTYTPRITASSELPANTQLPLYFCDPGEPHSLYTTAEEMTNTVTAPSGDKVIHYFSVWSKPYTAFNSFQPQVSPNGFDWDEYGLPLSHAHSISFAGKTLFVSTQTIDCSSNGGVCPSIPCGATGQPLCVSPCTRNTDGTGTCPVVDRSEYVAYDHDLSIQIAANASDASDLQSRTSAKATVYDSDGARVAGTSYDQFDGLGHYRKATTSGTGFRGATQRTTFTGYNPSVAFTSYPSYIASSANPVFVPTGNAWLLGIYDKQTSSESAGGTLEKRFCFDSSTGFLLGQRQLFNAGAESTKDLLTIDSPTRPSDNVNTGDVWDRKEYGGSVAIPAAVAGACPQAALPATPEYETQNRYVAGVRTSSQVVGVSFKSYDATLDASGLVSALRDENGVGTAFEYDALGRMTWIKPGNDPGATGTASSYDAWTEIQYVAASGTCVPSSAQWTGCANIQTRRRASGSKNGTVLSEAWRVYDGLGRHARERQRIPAAPGWSEQFVTYNLMGWKTFESLADGQTSFLAGTTYRDFDAYGRAHTVVRSDGFKTLFSFAGDRAMNRWELVGTGTGYNGAPCGATLANCKYLYTDTYDVLGRLAQRSLPSTTTGTPASDTTISYTYDAADHVLAISTQTTTSGTQTRQFGYDGLGFLRSETLPEQTISMSSYDSHGNFRERTDGKNDLVYFYDKADRLVEIDDKLAGNTPLKKFVYDRNPLNPNAGLSQGKVVESVRYNYRDVHVLSVTEDYAYFGRHGRLSSRETSLRLDNSTSTDSERFNQQFSYNDLGVPDVVYYPTCSPSFAACAAAGVPNRTVTYGYSNGLMSSVSGYAALYYDSSPILRQIAYTNGQVWQQDRDASRIPRAASICLRTVADGQACPAGGGGLGPYVYDGVGNVLAEGGGQYTYDTHSRVTSGMLSSGQKQSYLYDGFDNIQCATSNVFGFSHYTPTSAARNQLTPATSVVGCPGATPIANVAYDAAGNLSTWQNTTYTFDALNELARVTSGSYDWYYMYNADGERVLSTSISNPQGTRLDRWVLRAVDGRPLRVLDATGFVFRWSKDYIYADSKIIASEAPLPEGRGWFYTDQLGSPRIISSGLGTFGHHYFPFGEEPLGSGDQEIYKFAGHERDANDASVVGDDLDYLHARYEAPALARFLSPDPARHDHPQAANLYAYAHNNPVRFTDPTGEVEEPGTAAECPDCAGTVYDSITVTAQDPYGNELSPFAQQVFAGVASRTAPWEPYIELMWDVDQMVLGPFEEAEAPVELALSRGESALKATRSVARRFVFKARKGVSAEEEVHLVMKEIQANITNSKTAGGLVRNPTARTANLKAQLKALGIVIPKGYDVDHIIELQVGGLDDISNVQWIPSYSNRSAGTQLKLQLANPVK